MKVTIRINPKTKLAYIPDDLTNEGFIGDVEALADAKTVTLFQPGASLDEIEKSLLIVLADVRLRKPKKEAKEE